MSRTFKLTIAYDGTDFVGWQVQPNGESIQSTLQRAIAAVTKQTVAVVGSGRTDSGVHALAQVASCTLQRWTASAADLGQAINSFLPPAVVVHSVVDAPDDFHPIRDATGKRYRYQIQIGGSHDPFSYRYRWRVRAPLDVQAMQTAAKRLEGERDFASFQAAGAPRKSTVRHVRACQVVVQNDPPATVRQGNSTQRQDITIEVEANGFLYNMVRNIVGTLVEVGRGKHPPAWVDDVIAAREPWRGRSHRATAGTFLVAS